jgi:hypothetical protein
MSLAPGVELASIMAARKEQFPLMSAQMPFPGFISTVSSVVFTTNCPSPAVVQKNTAARKEIALSDLMEQSMAGKTWRGHLTEPYTAR